MILIIFNRFLLFIRDTFFSGFSINCVKGKVKRKKKYFIYVIWINFANKRFQRH